MSRKERVIKRMKEMYDRECGASKSAIGDCINLVQNLLDEEHENVECAKPNFEAMYHDAMKKLEQCAKAQDSLFEENRCLKMELMQLHGFKTAVELIFRKDRDCHGRCETA